VPRAMARIDWSSGDPELVEPRRHAIGNDGATTYFSAADKQARWTPEAVKRRADVLASGVWSAEAAAAARIGATKPSRTNWREVGMAIGTIDLTCAQPRCRARVRRNVQKLFTEAGAARSTGVDEIFV
jgi:hypothetical protein